jgi:hypothetical protein
MSRWCWPSNARQRETPSSFPIDCSYGVARRSRDREGLAGAARERNLRKIHPGRRGSIRIAVDGLSRMMGYRWCHICAAKNDVSNTNEKVV